MIESNDITQLLVAWRKGDKSALDELIPKVYNVLYKLAIARLRSERPNHSLQATALVNEAYLRIMNQKDINWQNRAHFFGVAAHLMRNILIDYARNSQSAKRGGDKQKIVLEEIPSPSKEGRVDLVALDKALSELELIDTQKGKIVELRYFGGLTIEETAEAMDISTGTIKREWNVAKAWLFRKLSDNK